MIDKEQQMEECIILAPGIKGSELVRSLALHGVNSMGLRICSAVELARMALMRSGIAITEDFVSGKEEAAIVAEAVLEETYFNRTSYSGIREIASVLRRMRHLVVAEDEAQELKRVLLQGIFREKNTALLHVYQKYMEILSGKGAVDGVSLVRRAASESKVIDATFLTVEEFPLTPLEQSLLQKVSGGNAKEVSLPELFHADRKPVHVSSVQNCYGAPNEVESILADIYSGKRFDQCTVAVTDTITYSQLFFDYAVLYDIPVTFGCGIPITNSNPARLASSYLRWSTVGFFGKTSVTELLSGSVFNWEKLTERLSEIPGEYDRKTLRELLGNLRLTNDKEINEKRIADFQQAVSEEYDMIAGGDDASNSEEETKNSRHIRKKIQCIPCLKIIAEELALPAEEFISRYALTRKGGDTNAERLTMMLDMEASEAIYEELKTMRSVGKSVEDILPSILKLNVCRQRSEAGKLHVTSIEGAFSTIRKNLYIAGLSASIYPGSPKENYLLLDADLDLFGPGAEEYKSDQTVLRKRRQFMSLASLASSLGVCVTVSFSGMNVSELKRDNPSSLVYELLMEEYRNHADSKEPEKHIRNVGYFEPALSASRLVGDAYIKGETILTEGLNLSKTGPVPFQPGKAWSPTELDAFFRCPRRFMLKFLLRIPEPEDYDPFQVITPADGGNLAHSLMEELGNTSMRKEDFLKMSEDAFDRFLSSHPPLVAGNVPTVREREQFLDMMAAAYEMDPHREVVLEEEDIRAEHESGVRIHGFPDRVEKLEDGSCLIVDFKTGRKVVHEQDDINSCLQVVIYAYLMESKGEKVSGGEYRYLRLGGTVTCKYDDEMKKSLSDRLEKFLKCMQSGDFSTGQVSENAKDPCENCKYDRVCGKADRPEEETGDGKKGGTA